MTTVDEPIPPDPPLMQTDNRPRPEDGQQFTDQNPDTDYSQEKVEFTT